jgi:hypothetical protein
MYGFRFFGEGENNTGIESIFLSFYATLDL